ncbi:nucleotide binding protein 2 [Theileria orientalis]|uniref:Nucleotide binding protein 2 n=1 Tax=Theileria orientalis TaxID=68886 RepID=A0A976QTZ9_THEOR|nr:nucleotide binding protein 2 [Theileria orientalis]
MNDNKNSNTSYWSRFLGFLYEYRNDFKIIAFIAAYHYFQKYASKPKSPQYDDSDVPDSCPGPGTEKAGLSTSCEGCPNKAFCSSNNPNTGEAEVRNCLKNIENIIIVASGKGGVGKSTVATQLAFSLDHLGKRVGLLDVDITGPSVPSMTGTTGQEVFESLLGWTPVYVDNLSVMSIGYLMSNHESSISWRGAKKDALIKKFLTSVNWGELDYLVIDTPPGTSDEHITLVNTLKTLVKDGAGFKRVRSILVTTPQKRALDDAKRSAQFCNDLGVEILMLVENMTNSFFDKFTTEGKPGGGSPGNSQLMREVCNKYNIKKYVRVDSDPSITEAGETGSFVAENNPFMGIARSILEL